MKFTAAMYLAAFAAQAPRAYEEDPGRFAVVAVAAERTQEELLPKWQYSPEQFAGALTSGILHESYFDEDVHSGANHKNGNCLMQIHHTNGLFGHELVGAPSFDALLGTDLQATTWCLLTGGMTLVNGSSYCHKRHFYTYWQKAMWTMYATGRRCHPWSRQAGRRSALQNKIAYTLWKPTDEHHRLIVVVLEQEKNDRSKVQPGPHLQDGGTE